MIFQLNKKPVFFSLAFALSVAAFSAPAELLAETQYVSDRLIITVRTGQGSQYAIIKTLNTGEHVEVLEETDTGYARVRTTDGTEGWVRTQYLIKEPVAAELLEKLQAKFDKTTERYSELKTKYATLSTEHKNLTKAHEELTREKGNIDAELAKVSEVAKKPILLDRKNRELETANIELKQSIERLVIENQSLSDRSNREWFIAGALVMLGGFLIGIIAPKLRPKKRSSW